MLHPIGSCIILSDTIDPNALFDGTVWELIGQDKCIIGAGNKFTAMQDIPAGLPNIEGEIYGDTFYNTASANDTNSIYWAGTYPSSALHVSVKEYNVNKVARYTTTDSTNFCSSIAFNASLSNSIYGSSDTVQPPSIALFIWRRTA